MSTLTKILVVLLTISTISLCAVVVTYVANADNFREKEKAATAKLRTESQKLKDLRQQFNQQKTRYEQSEDTLNGKLASLQAETETLQADLTNTEREKAALLQKVNNWSSITKDFYETNDKQGQLLQETLEKLKQVRAEQIKQEKELKETSAVLIEKMAIIENLQAQKKQLVEQKTHLQNMLDRHLQPMGKLAAETVTVTPRRDVPRMALPPAKDISLKALVTAVDVKHSMASISIGSADGVKEGMKFHVTRGDDFICDILILDTDTEEAVGVLDLVQQQPKVGDNAATNF